ncbi:MAG TPA: sugar ABC transporter ATP-binding protein [Ktedonobacteraceae bacterium]|nr:sugar ABC transporter ATP-binding protein [Ktedonobacteraceae bacterium]
MNAVIQPLLSFRGMVKQLGGTLAVAGVDLDIYSGEIHALLGANGAGKSTLIKLLAGIHKPDNGEILFRGHAIHAHEVEKLPIAFIHQDLGLFDWMTVAENIAIGRGYTRRYGLIDWKRQETDAIEALKILGGEISPDTRVADLSRTDKSIVAIARALSKEIDLLVLDEPTSSLPEAEVSILFDVLERLRKRGVGMIYVTHRLDEVFRLADRATVMRDGKKVGSAEVGDITAAELVRLIVGQAPSKVFVPPVPHETSVVAEAADLRTYNVGPVSFRIRAGEILGFCGLRGAGQNDIGRVLSGILPITGGTLSLRGNALNLKGSADAIRHGISFISSNREDESLAMTLTVKENLFLNPVIRGRKVLQPLTRSAEFQQADTLVKKFLIRPDDPNRVVSTLSGGNQQKVVLARWLSTDVHLLVMEEPTLGVDVGARAEIYAMLAESAAQEHAVVLVSSDLEEVAKVCSRVLIFNRGRIIGELQRPTLSLADLTALVTGAVDENKERSEADV